MRTDPGLPMPWTIVLRRAAARTLRAAPWIWAATMVPVVVNGVWKLKAVASATLVAVTLLPVVFVVAVGLQRFSRTRQWTPDRRSSE